MSERVRHGCGGRLNSLYTFTKNIYRKVAVCIYVMIMILVSQAYADTGDVAFEAVFDAIGGNALLGTHNENDDNDNDSDSDD